MGSTSEGVVHGVIEHIMTEGGILGTPGSEYALVSMPPDNPAMSVRIHKEENGTWKPTAYSIGMMYKDAEKADMNNHSMDSEIAMAMYDSSIGKAYEGCGCPMCKELNVTCEQCPQCQAGEMKSDCCGNVNKQAPCWDGYVQRGMKPGAGGRMVPNCVPVNEQVSDTSTSQEKFDSRVNAANAPGLSRKLKVTVLSSAAKLHPAAKKTFESFMIEASAAWQRKEGKNLEGGLNAAGVASYRRQNPGSKLQTAVTTKPSKLKPGSKDAKRRKSFCARMSGVDGPMKDEKGRPTRKALSLKKWNC